jgi:hypothetical protein
MEMVTETDGGLPGRLRLDFGMAAAALCSAKLGFLLGFSGREEKMNLRRRL